MLAGTNAAMAEHQISLRLDANYHPAPAVGADLRAEIAAAWGLPLGQRVEVGLRNQPCALRGILELERAPDYPWDGRQALRLAVAGFVFSSREMESWAVL
jgi:hypothetical protein